MAEKRDNLRSPLERRMEIIETTIRSQGRVRTGALAERFGIKQNLLAHDINALVELGLVERGHGWVAARRPKRTNQFEGTEFAARRSRCHKAKQAIASYIAEQLRDAGEVILDAGSTSLAIAQQLIQNAQTLDVFTNNVAALLQLAHSPRVTCRLIGGTYSHNQAATTGVDDADAIEGRTLGAGVLTPRALALIPSKAAQAEQLPSGNAVRAALSQVARHQGVEMQAAARNSLFLSIYSSNSAEKPMKSLLIKNSTRLFIAADCTKLFAGGEPFFTIILPALLDARQTRDKVSDESPVPRRMAFSPVRSRGAVRMRRALSQEHLGSDETPSVYGDIDVDASVDVRDPGSTILVTSTDEHDNVPTELLRQLQALSLQESFENIMELVESTIVVVNRRGEPVPLGFPL